MMINRRLIGTVGESRKYIAGNVLLQWLSLLANIGMMASVTMLLAGLFALVLAQVFRRAVEYKQENDLTI